jgi:hypothetical protein
MNTARRHLVFAVLVTAIVLWASPASAEVSNLSGTWNLDVEKSDFGKRPKWKNATLQVEHKEPSLKYTLTGTTADGKPLKIEFSGAIDGKEYPVVGSPYSSKASITRVNNSTTKGVATSDDGKTVETYTVTVSKDGKKFERKGTVKGPEGEFKNHALYEKQ